MTSRHVRDGETFQDFTLNYDAENRLVSVTGAATASFVYDGDGKQIKATVNGTTTVYVGNHYEVKNSVVTKYYFAGTTRLAVRTNGTLKYLLSDHLGSTTLSTDANGTVSASALYKAFGELRITPSDLGTDYKFTGQREEASLGIYFFNARWYDGSLGRFLSPDTIVPTSTQGTQAWDRYAFVNNNPVRYNDPTGHRCVAADGEDGGCLNDDGTAGSGFNGVASANGGSASHKIKGCGMPLQRDCQGGNHSPSFEFPVFKKEACVDLYFSKYCGKVSASFTVSGGSPLTVKDDGFSIGAFDFSSDDGITIWFPELSATSGNVSSKTKIGGGLSDGTAKGIIESGNAISTPDGIYNQSATFTSEFRVNRAVGWGTVITLALYGTLRLITSGDPSTIQTVPQFIP
jgi:RHS repeat-associated protein